MNLITIEITMNIQARSSNSLVPFLDLRASYIELKLEIDEAVANVLDSGWYVLGKEVERFEEEWAAYCGASHAVGVGNGLDALVRRQAMRWLFLAILI